MNAPQEKMRTIKYCNPNDEIVYRHLFKFDSRFFVNVLLCNLIKKVHCLLLTVTCQELGAAFFSKNSIQGLLSTKIAHCSKLIQVPLYLRYFNNHETSYSTHIVHDTVDSQNGMQAIDLKLPHCSQPVK